MRIIIFILIFSGFILKGQDKLFFKNGDSKKGIIVSMGNDFVFFKTSDTSLTLQKISKSEILLIERFDGKIFIFSKSSLEKDSVLIQDKKIFRNSIGLQPLNFLLGRITGAYERLNKDGTIGFVFPLSLTFDPVGVI